MRKAEQKEVRAVAAFMAEQFLEKEELQTMFAGIEPVKAKKIAVELIYFELMHMIRHGDIYMYDENISGAIVGIEYKYTSVFRRLSMILQGNRFLQSIPKDDLDVIKKNSVTVSEAHSRKWFKKYCKNPYYLVQFGIAKEKRGTGIARKMLEQIFERAKQSGNRYIVVETLTASIVPMYEHFGFELKEVYETKNGKLTEYRMLKKI